MGIRIIPWLLAGATALWFGWVAHRAERNWVIWAVGGFAFGLVASTIILGLGHAASIPFSDSQRFADHLEWTLAAIAVIAGFGWLLTMGLHKAQPLPTQKPVSPPPPQPPTPVPPSAQPELKGQK